MRCGLAQLGVLKLPNISLARSLVSVVPWHACTSFWDQILVTRTGSVGLVLVLVVILALNNQDWGFLPALGKLSEVERIFGPQLNFVPFVNLST